MISDLGVMVRKYLAKQKPETILILLLFVLNLLLVASSLLPSYDEINPFDGAKYIESGRQLVDGGELREISRSPTLALMYAVIYLFVRSSLNWFVELVRVKCWDRQYSPLLLLVVSNFLFWIAL